MYYQLTLQSGKIIDNGNISKTLVDLAAVFGFRGQRVKMIDVSRSFSNLFNLFKSHTNK